MESKEYLMNYNECGKFIFLEFTKELIRNYSPEEILRIKNKIQEKLESESKIKEFLQPKEKTIQVIREESPSIIQKEEYFPSMMNLPKKEKQLIVKKEDEPFVKKEWFPPIKEEGKALILKKEEEFPNMQKYKKIIGTRQEENQFGELKLIIPETKFPLHLQYIHPVPINKDVDLGKLNPLVNDRFVKIIECNGPNENLMVKGAMGNKKTGIILNDEEIKAIINKFSEETKIPAHEGFFKVASGRLLFSAIVSENVGSKFIISKIPLQEQGETYRIQNSIYS